MGLNEYMLSVGGAVSNQPGVPLTVIIAVVTAVVVVAVIVIVIIIVIMCRRPYRLVRTDIIHPSVYLHLAY